MALTALSPRSHREVAALDPDLAGAASLAHQRAEADAAVVREAQELVQAAEDSAVSRIQSVWRRKAKEHLVTEQLAASATAFKKSKRFG